MNTIGKWNPAWGPEPVWQGPVKPTKRRYWLRLVCPEACRPAKEVWGPLDERFVCVDCRSTMHVERVMKGSGPRTKIGPGDRFGLLVVLEVERKVGGRLWAVCVCDCGEHKSVQLDHLRDGGTKSCGCYRRSVGGANSPWRRR